MIEFINSIIKKTYPESLSTSSTNSLCVLLNDIHSCNVKLGHRWHSSSIHSFACSLVHSELHCWGLNSSTHLHVAHMHNCSHYSVHLPVNTVGKTLGAARNMFNNTSRRMVCPAGPFVVVAQALNNSNHPAVVASHT
jgi:hypothetical protein